MGSAGGSSVHSVSVDELRREASSRRSAARRSRIPQILFRVVIVLVVLAVIGAGAFIAASMSGVFDVKKVTVTDTKYLTSEELTDLAAVRMGTTLLDVNTSEIESRLKSNPWVLDAKVERVYPDTINLRITEREIGATVEIAVDEAGTEQIWTLSKDGVWLAPVSGLTTSEEVSTTQTTSTASTSASTSNSSSNTSNSSKNKTKNSTNSSAKTTGSANSSTKNSSNSSSSTSATTVTQTEAKTITSDESNAIQPSTQAYTDAQAALRISDVPYGTLPEVGATCTDSHVLNALGIIKGMTTELADQIKYVSASSSESTTLVLQNGIEISFGDDSNIRDKERVCLQLIEEHEGKIAYINVRTVSNPIWRALS